MKVRTGFVSNSSSSSFLIYGAWVDEADVRAILESTLSYEDMEHFEEYGDNNIPMFVHKDENIDRYAFGLSYTDIKDSETGGEFKLRVNKQLKETFGKTIKCNHISHTYYC